MEASWRSKSATFLSNPAKSARGRGEGACAQPAFEATKTPRAIQATGPTDESLMRNLLLESRDARCIRTSPRRRAQVLRCRRGLTAKAQQRRGTAELEIPETNHAPPSAAAPGSARLASCRMPAS